MADDAHRNRPAATQVLHEPLLGAAMTDDELRSLLGDLESDRCERKASLADPDRVREAICAFANDLPDHRQPGVVFIGARDDGSCAGLEVTDRLLQQLADMRSDGNILPTPAMTVQKRVVDGCTFAVVVVQPSEDPPVRYRGRIWIRVGPRRAIANASEERILSDKRRARDLPFDLTPVPTASLDDLDLQLFERTYLPSAVARDVLERNHRSLEQQLRSLRMVTAEDPTRPTVTGILALGTAPADFVPGAYVQFLRIEGRDLADPIADQKTIGGPLLQLLRQVDEVLKAHIRIRTDIRSGSLERQQPDYPLEALVQLIRNAVMHRDYATTHAPVRLTWFSDRIEIQNPGGPFGQVTVANFGQPGVTDYRNPHLAEVMRNLGFVQRFGVGIATAQRALAENGNPELRFEVEQNHVLAVVGVRS